MERYTDIDLLIDKVEKTTWYHINKNGELVKGANSERDIPLYKHSDITRVLADAPTADVVPKSEVEETIELSYNKGFADGNNLAVNGIKKVFNSMGERCTNDIIKQTIYALTKDMDALLVTEDELKKKYTENKE